MKNVFFAVPLPPVIIVPVKPLSSAWQKTLSNATAAAYTNNGAKKPNLSFMGIKRS